MKYQIFLLFTMFVLLWLSVICLVAWVNQIEKNLVRLIELIRDDELEKRKEKQDGRNQNC